LALFKLLISNRLVCGTVAARADMLVFWRGNFAQPQCFVRAHAPFAPTLRFPDASRGGHVSGRTLPGLSPAARSRTRTAAGDPAL